MADGQVLHTRQAKGQVTLARLIMTHLCILLDLLADVHAAELWSTHGTEVGCLCWLLGQGGIVVGPGCHWVQRQSKLVVPAF